MLTTPCTAQGLFKEYVQGTEDEMKKPRSKGGTGLGLSICSKQVVLALWSGSQDFGSFVGLATFI